MYKVTMAVALEPFKREKEGFVIHQIGTHRLKRKMIQVEPIYVGRP